jgi:hypothetical protein
MRNVAIRENCQVDIFALYHCFQQLFFNDGDAIGIQIAGEFGWVDASCYVGNLCSCEGDYVVIGIIPE